MIINTCTLLEIRCEFLFKLPNASQAGLDPLPPPPSLAWMKIKCLWVARGEGSLKKQKDDGDDDDDGTYDAN